MSAMTRLQWRFGQEHRLGTASARSGTEHAKISLNGTSSINCLTLSTNAELPQIIHPSSRHRRPIASRFPPSARFSILLSLIFGASFPSSFSLTTTNITWALVPVRYTDLLSVFVDPFTTSRLAPLCATRATEHKIHERGGKEEGVIGGAWLRRHHVSA